MAERVIAVELQVNTGDSSKELQSVKSQLEGIEDEVRNVSKATRESQAAASFEKLNKVVDDSVLSIQELGTAADNYKNIAIAAGVASPIGREALEKAAQLENQMDQLNRSVAQVAEGGRALNTAMQLGTGIIAGYSAFQGVTALLGSENEDLQKTFVKLQAAQATLMGVKELSIALDRKGLLATQAQAAGNAILTASTIAYNAAVGTSTGLMKAFRIALFSTGIGAIIVGLGLLIANFETVQKWVQSLTGYLQSFGDAIISVAEFFGLVEEGTTSTMKAERKLKEERKKADAELKQQHASRLQEIDEQLKATLSASNGKIDALKLEKDTLEANGKSSANVTMQILQEQLAQTQAVLDANAQKLQSWIKYYTDQAALRGQNEEEFKASMKAQGVDLEALQGKFNKILKDNENAVKYSENEITRFKREQLEARSKDLEEAFVKDIITQLDYQAESLASFSNYKKSLNDDVIIFDDFGDEIFENLEIQQEESLTKFQSFVHGLGRLFTKGKDGISEEMEGMLADIAAGVQMAMDTFMAVNDVLNELGDRRIQKIQDRSATELSNLEAAKKKELSREGLTANQKIKIEQDFAMASYKTELKAAQAADKIAEKQFKRDKKLKLAQIGIDTASAIVKAIAMFGPPPSPLGIAGIASAGIIGGLQAGVVASSQFQGSAGSITPPSFDTPSIGADTGSGSDNNGSSNTGQNDTTTSTDTLLNLTPIIISQVEINRVQSDMARIDNLSVL